MHATQNKTNGSPDAATKNAPGKLPFFQPKLTINEPGDQYEQEADRMADRVMRMPANSLSFGEGRGEAFFKPSPLSISRLQRKCKDCEDDEKIHRKENSSQPAEANSETASYINSLSSKGSPLPDSAKSFFEPRFGQDFSSVKIHNDSEAAKSSQAVNAVAYTLGNNIVFNQNQFSPESDGGKRLLAHELTHVVQQGKDYSQPQLKTKNNKTYPLDNTKSTNFSIGQLKSKNHSENKVAIQRQAIPWEIPIDPFQGVEPAPFEGVEPIPFPDMPIPPFMPAPDVEINEPDLAPEPELDQEPNLDTQPDPEPEPQPIPPIIPNPEADKDNKDKDKCGSKRMPFTNVNFNTGPLGQANAVVAQPLTKCPGNTRGSLANWRVYPEQFKCIKKMGLGRYWLPVHMLHGMTPRPHTTFRNLHGPGNDKRNIIIAHSSINRQMNAHVEEPALTRVYDLNQVLWYESKVDAYFPGAEFFAQSITVNYGLMDMATGNRGPRYGGGTFTSSAVPPNCPVSLGGATMPAPLLPTTLADFNSILSVCKRVLESRRFSVNNGGLKVNLNASRPSICAANDYYVSLEKENMVDDEISSTKIPANKAVTLTWGQLEKGEYYLKIWVPVSPPRGCCLKGTISIFTFDAPMPAPVRRGRVTA